MPENPGDVIALAGRRIDAPDAKERRFPATNVELVAARIRALFQEIKPVSLVCSAASGADLIALDVAGQLAIERHIILPFAPEVFCKTSVADSGPEWELRFDLIVTELGVKEELCSLGHPSRDHQAFSAANEEVLRRAQELAAVHCTRAKAVIVWNGVARKGDDNTKQFADAARNAGFPVHEILTL